MAVLRVDERGVAGSTGDRSTVTMFTEAEDVETALAFLRGRSEIDAQRLGLIGHSEGGTIAPMIAARDTTVRLVAVLAGLGGPGQEMMEFQLSTIDPATTRATIQPSISHRSTARLRNGRSSPKL